jgi:UDP-glucose 4-epimerase
MKVTIFGGGGFIGSAIADRLLADGHTLRIFERPRVNPYREFLPHEQVEWMAGDILSIHDLGQALIGADAVIHLVSTTLPKTSNDDPIYDVQSNIVGTLQMLNAMVAHKVPRMVFISSGGTVYGKPNKLPIDESHSTDPQVSYGITKLAIEKYILMYERLHGIRAVILRVANPYGERQRIETAQGVVGAFLHRVLKGQSIEIWGDGSVTRDFLHVSDVAEAFAKALGYSGDHKIFNIGSGSGVSLNHLIEIMEKTLGMPVMRDYKTARAFDVPVSVLCNQLARSELGWVPAVGLEAGIARTAEWMKRKTGA